MHFTKMQGLGNDYLYVYGEPENPSELSVRLSDRHFGAGSDGMIFISPSDAADFRMRIFNADGSEAEMCGNGIRCVGKYLYDKGYTDKKRLKIETRAGIRTLELTVSGGKVKRVTVDMGKASCREMTLEENGQRLCCTLVSVGNPHLVLFVDHIESAPLTTLGPRLSAHEAFPEGVNVEFVQPLGDGALRMRVWERGSGVTMACGTGACAAAAAALEKGICRREDPIRVELDGGTLTIAAAADNTLCMTGPAEFVYEGEVV